MDYLDEIFLYHECFNIDMELCEDFEENIDCGIKLFYYIVVVVVVLIIIKINIISLKILQVK